MQQILIPRTGEPRIRVTVEHSPQDEHTRITFRYGGKVFDIRNTENELALKVLKGIAEEICYDREEEAGFKNRVTVVTR